MKTFTIIFAILLLSSILATAQTDTSYWYKGGYIGIKVSQTSYTNWAKGGENSLATIGNFQYFANYKKGEIAWDNIIYADLGYLKQGKESFKKTDDRFEVNSKFGHVATKSLYYSALLSFKTQFVEGYDYSVDTPVYISNLFAPAYLNLSLGFDYKPNKYFSLFISPAALRWTLVNDQELADGGAFGLEKAVYGLNGNLISHAKKLKTEGGATLRMAFARDIFKNINFQSKLDLFSNYVKNPQNIDVDWETLLTFKVNDFFNASLNAHLIYDDDILIGVDSDEDGSIDYKAPRTQFKEVIGLGIVYKFK